jgi:chaperonin GroES
MLRPLRDCVVVKPSEVKKVTKGGIHIPETAQNDTRTRTGVVLAVGPGRLEDGTVREPDVKKRDTVLFGQHSGHRVQYDGQEYWILSSDSILAVIE